MGEQENPIACRHTGRVDIGGAQLWCRNCGALNNLGEWLSPWALRKSANFLDREVDQIGLTTAVVYALRRAGITYVGELVMLSRHDVRRLKNVGRKSEKRIDAVLGAEGLSLGMDIGAWRPPDGAEPA